MSDPEIEDRVIAISALPGFDIPDWWLTFHLTARPTLLEAMAERLLAYRAVNLGDADGGFLYPKIPVKNDPQDVAAMIREIERVAASSFVKIIAVDADTSSDIPRAKFAEITRYG